eukprot:PhM_4_TR9612/c0_g1_i1/m.60926
MGSSSSCCTRTTTTAVTPADATPPQQRHHNPTSPSDVASLSSSRVIAVGPVSQPHYMSSGANSSGRQSANNLEAVSATMFGTPVEEIPTLRPARSATPPPVMQHATPTSTRSTPSHHASIFQTYENEELASMVWSLPPPLLESNQSRLARSSSVMSRTLTGLESPNTNPTMPIVSSSAPQLSLGMSTNSGAGLAGNPLLNVSGGSFVNGWGVSTIGGESTATTTARGPDSYSVSEDIYDEL